MRPYRQNGRADCGVVCVAAIASHFNLYPSIGELRASAGTRKDGTSVLGIIQSASSIGLIARGIKTEKGVIPETPCPMIAHVLVDGQLSHFVVVDRVKRGKLRVMDPADGLFHQYTSEDFHALSSGVFILFARAIDGDALHQGRHHKRIISWLRPQLPQVVEVALGGLVVSVLALTPILYIRILLDDVIADNNRGLLNTAFFCLVAVVAVRTVLAFFQSIMVSRIGKAVDLQLRNNFFDKINELPEEYLESIHSFELLRKYGDIGVLKKAYVDSFIAIILNSSTLIIAEVLLLFASLDAFFVVNIGLSVLVAIHLLSSMGHLARVRNSQKSDAELFCAISDFVANIGVFRRYGSFRDFRLSLDQKMARNIQINDDLYRADSNLKLFDMSMIQIVSACVAWHGAHQALDGALTAGALLACYSLAFYVINPFSSILGLIPSFKTAAISAQRISEIFEVKPVCVDGSLRISEDELNSIKFDRVAFQCQGARSILTGLCFTIKNRRTTLIQIPSRLGKTTLSKLIFGELQPTEGSVEINGHSTAAMSRSGILHLFSICEQKVKIISGSVFENVTLGNSKPDIERFFKIIKMVGIFEIVNRLPKRHETIIGENGLPINYELKKLICLARAVYANRRAFIFDDPDFCVNKTSGSSAFRRILASLWINRCTVIILSSDNSLVEFCDDIIEIDQSGSINVRKGSANFENISSVASG